MVNEPSQVDRDRMWAHLDRILHGDEVPVYVSGEVPRAPQPLRSQQRAVDVVVVAQVTTFLVLVLGSLWCLSIGAYDVAVVLAFMAAAVMTAVWMFVR